MGKLLKLLCLASAVAFAQQSPAGQWNALVLEFPDNVYFKSASSAGTAAGFHQFDALLLDYFCAGIDQQVRRITET